MANGGDVILLGDVGGTNCRLALETSAAPRTITHRIVYSTDDFPSPREAIAAFLAHAGGAKPRRAALAVAAPVTGDLVQLTNTSWRFDREVLRQALGFEQLVFVNDLAAQARAIATLGAEDFVTISIGVAPPFTRAMSVVGPGTGLGVACIDPARRDLIVTTEGGHAGFSPGDDVEMELLRLWRQHLGAVSNEHVISGPGMVRLYRALGALKDVHVDPIDGPEIVRRAIANEDAHSRETAERFAKILGGVAGDVVMVQGAAGVVLVGGIVNSLAPILQLGGFRARFEQRGPGRAFLTEAPSLIVTAADLGFKGTSALLHAGDARA
jgi:glucokinase